MFQTLEGFLAAPFGSPEIKSNEFERTYQAFRKKKGSIYIESITTIEDNYLLHIKVKSESSSRFYDVVILFFTDDEKIKKDVSFRNYYVKFFSNSPSFIYQYAVLYKENGILIDMLYDKMDPEYMDTKPTKTNPNNKVSYDKSIYIACRFMQDHKISAFSKAGFLATKKRKPDAFFKEVKGFEDVKLDTEIDQLDKRVDKEFDKAKKSKDNHTSQKSTNKSSNGKKKAVYSTLPSSEKSGVRKVSATSKVSKRRPKRTTFGKTVKK